MRCIEQAAVLKPCQVDPLTEEHAIKLFDPRSHDLSEAHRRIHAYAALAYTVVDFAAALLFVVGSALFFNESTTTFATWLFLIGSIFFGLRPTITMLREIAYIRAGDYKDAASD